jgi:hypothetical protein
MVPAMSSPWCEFQVAPSQATSNLAELPTKALVTESSVPSVATVRPRPASVTAACSPAAASAADIPVVTAKLTLREPMRTPMVESAGAGQAPFSPEAVAFAGAWVTTTS